MCCGAWGDVSLSKLIIMTKFSSIVVLTAFFVCGIALGAHARDVEKIAQQGPVSVEVSNEAEAWHDFNILPVSAVLDFKAEPDQCLVVAEITCGQGDDEVVVVTVESIADDCKQAIDAVYDFADKVTCIGFD